MFDLIRVKNEILLIEIIFCKSENACSIFPAWNGIGGRGREMKSLMRVAVRGLRADGPEGSFPIEWSFLLEINLSLLWCL